MYVCRRCSHLNVYLLIQREDNDRQFCHHSVHRCIEDYIKLRKIGSFSKDRVRHLVAK